jgi:hypothetical protein
MGGVWMIGRVIGRFAVVAALVLSGCVVRQSVQIVPFRPIAAAEPSAAVEYSDFWDAMAHWDLSYVRNHPINSEQRRYAQALANMDRGDIDRGIEIARDLQERGSDATARKNARKLLNTMFVAQWQWDRIILPDPNEVLSESDAEAKEIAEQIRRLPRQEHEFHEPVVQIQAEKRKELLFLPVQINGRTRSLALDTGADGTVLASDVAALCGVELVPNYTHKGRTINGYVTSQLGRIDRLDVGGLAIHSHPVAVFPKRDTLTPGFQIDGVLGCMAIRAMDIEIDYNTSIVTIRKPEARKDVTANLLPTHSLTCRVRTPTGIPALMTFDTGAYTTILFKNSLSYLGLAPRGRAISRFTTFGSQKSTLSGIIPEMDFVLGTSQVHWTNTITIPDPYGEPGPVKPVGVLGSDIFRDGGHVRIDWTNRRADFWWDAVDQNEEDI